MWIRGVGLSLVLGFTTVVAGCDTLPMTTETMTYDAMVADVSRSFEANFAEKPFVNGTIAIVARENGELRTYRLVPCQNGAAICMGSNRGPAAQLRVTADHYIVSGLYGNRTFFLRPGGGGTLRRGGIDVPLAWNAYVNGLSRVEIDGIYPYGQFASVRY
jgi:hypothetical protein